MALSKAEREFQRENRFRMIGGNKYRLSFSGLTKKQALGNAALRRKQFPNVSYRVVKVGKNDVYTKGREYAVYSRMK